MALDFCPDNKFKAALSSTHSFAQNAMEHYLLVKDNKQKIEIIHHNSLKNFSRTHQRRGNEPSLSLQIDLKKKTQRNNNKSLKNTWDFKTL